MATDMFAFMRGTLLPLPGVIEKMHVDDPAFM
jgi:hypothetical protein